MTIEIELHDRRLRATLNRLANNARDLTPAMREIAGVLADAAEEAFEQEADPTTGQAWPALAPSTIRAREKKGYWPGNMLQVSGQLAASIQTDYGRDFATAGSNKVYAAIHQLGGPAGRGGRSVIPARPYLGVSDDDVEEIIDILNAYLLGE